MEQHTTTAPTFGSAAPAPRHNAPQQQQSQQSRPAPPRQGKIIDKPNLLGLDPGCCAVCCSVHFLSNTCEASSCIAAHAPSVQVRVAIDGLESIPHPAATESCCLRTHSWPSVEQCTSVGCLLHRTPTRPAGAVHQGPRQRARVKAFISKAAADNKRATQAPDAPVITARPQQAQPAASWRT